MIRSPIVKTYCTTREAAALLGVSVGTVQAWVDSGLLQAWKTAGGHRRVLRDSLTCLLNQPRGDTGGSREPSPQPLPEETLPKLRRVRVLVVEDDPGLLHLYKTNLTRWPMAPEVTLAPDAPTGLMMMGRNKPDLLVTDLVMQPLDGFEMLAALHRTPSLETTTIVVVSGLDAAEISAHGGIPPDIEILPKPIPFQRLLAIATEIVNKRQQERWWA